MTTRLKGFTVVLEQDLRVDDAEVLVAAIRQLRGVADVLPVDSGWNDAMYLAKVRQELLGEIIKLFQRGMSI